MFLRFILSLSLLFIGAQAGPIERRQWNQSTISANDSSSLPLQLNRKNWNIKQAISGDFPDPSIWSNGKTWWAFSTTSHGINTQVATSPDFNTWTLQQGLDALPTPGAWVARPYSNIWAPDVFRNVSHHPLSSNAIELLTPFPEQRPIRSLLQRLSSLKSRSSLRRHRHLQHNHRALQRPAHSRSMPTIQRWRNRRRPLPRQRRDTLHGLQS